MAEVKVIKAKCNPDFKNKFKEFLKRTNESEAAAIRTAVKNYMDSNGARK